MKRFPPPVMPGDTVGIAAPAGPFNRALFDRGIQTLIDMGYRPFVPREAYACSGYLAGPDRLRAAALNRMFADPEIKAIVCARGGYGSMRMLRFLDFEMICRNPKAVVGFSDVSALLSALYTRCDLVTFHGPTVTTLAAADDVTIGALAAAVRRDRPVKIVPAAGRTLGPGVATGPIIGGNLTILSHLLGTAFLPDFKGGLLLLEDLNEAPYRIDRMLTQMRLSGHLEKVGGVMLGSFENCGGIDTVFRIVTDVLDGLTVPVLAGFDIGHGKTNITVPFGGTAELDADRQVLTICWPENKAHSASLQGQEEKGRAHGQKKMALVRATS